MRVNVGQAKTGLSKLLAAVEAGEDVEIARNGVPVARLVKADPRTPGQRLLDSWGSIPELAALDDSPALTAADIDAIYDKPIGDP